MFIDTGKFSTRTLSAIKNLDGTAIKKKTRNPEEYQWRKDMEQYVLQSVQIVKVFFIFIYKYAEIE